KMTIQEMAKLRSRKGLKFTIGLECRVSQKTRQIAPTSIRIPNVCTRPKGSPSQSHSCPLLRSTSQHTRVITSNPRPIESKLSGRFLNSARWLRRYSGSRTIAQQSRKARVPTGRLMKKIHCQEY